MPLLEKADIDEICERAQEFVVNLTKERDDLKEERDSLKEELDAAKAEIAEMEQSLLKMEHELEDARKEE
jgi:peptidoglycan hydrolase CwlO-like protein